MKGYDYVRRGVHLLSWDEFGAQCDALTEEIAGHDPEMVWAWRGPASCRPPRGGPTPEPDWGVCGVYLWAADKQMRALEPRVHRCGRPGPYRGLEIHTSCL